LTDLLKPQAEGPTAQVIMANVAVIVPVVVVCILFVLFCACQLCGENGKLHGVGVRCFDCIKEWWNWFFVDGYTVVDPEPNEAARRGQCTNPKVTCVLLFLAVIVSSVAGIVFSELDVSDTKAIGAALLVLLALILWVFQPYIPRLLPKDLRLLFPMFLIAVIIGGGLLITGFAICAVGRGKHWTTTQEYYVRQVAGTACAEPTEGSAFPVDLAPEHINVARLKEAIKAKLGTDYTRNAALIRICRRAANGTWVEEKNPEQPLHTSSARNPYGYLLPSATPPPT